jgi:uncharacterized protein YgiM (DUF1202 family)
MAAGVVMAGQEARVKSDRVNVRARPVDGAEVVGQVSQGVSVRVLKVEGAWAEVQAPTNLGVWVKGAFVSKGVVTADKVKVRSGPGVSYRDVGVLLGGTSVQMREEHGDWLRITPPEGITLWIAKDFLELNGVVAISNQMALVETGAVTGVDTQVVMTPHATMTQGLPEGLKESQLAAVLGQGAVLERQGVLERVPMAIFRGVEYRLVEVVDGRRVTTCYLRGRDAEMTGLMGKQIKVKGRAWWLSGEKSPLLYPDEMVGE